MLKTISTIEKISATRDEYLRLVLKHADELAVHGFFSRADMLAEQFEIDEDYLTEKIASKFKDDSK